MMTRISEVIQGWLGWCPDRMMALYPGTFKADNPVSSIPLGEGGFTIKDVIIDYGSTGMSVPVFIIILAGTIGGLFAFMRYGLFKIGFTLGTLLLISVAVRMVYQDIKKASIGFTPDAITIRRPLLGSVIIAKDMITTIEVRKNIHHSHRWLMLGGTAFLFISVIFSILFSGDSQYISRLLSQVSYTIFVMYYLAISVFFGLLFYHGYIRSRHSQLLAIRTNNRKIVGLFVDDLEKMYDVLSRWHTGVT
ncbi:MAG: hypothetical protein STSR0009_31430 [Methanoregula sp.]